MNRYSRINTLNLHEFRNYAHLSLDVGGASVVLTGHNGAGKTNILEAVSLLAPGRGMRRARLSEMDRLGGGAWVISATLDTPQGEVQIGTGRDDSAPETDKRLVRIDGKPARGHTALAEHVSIVWLTPENDQLFMEGPSARRKFLDRLVYGFDPEHASRVAAYEYAMRERNRLLADRRADPHWLSTLERKMAEKSLAIAVARMETAAHLNQTMQESRLSFPKADMNLTGFAEKFLAEGAPALHAEDAMAEALERSRHEDAQSGRSSFGAHKSELGVVHVAKAMPAELCSTGEQKALLLSIVLAEARAGARWHGRVPLMLLDEVVSHLDASRRAELFEEIQASGAQAWMTGTDAEMFAGMRGNARFFEVENAHVRPTEIGAMDYA